MLAFAMVLARFRAVTVPAIGAAVLLEPGLFAASQAAIALSPVTTGTDQELGLAFPKAANPLPKNELAMSSHAAPAGGTRQPQRLRVTLKSALVVT